MMNSISQFAVLPELYVVVLLYVELLKEEVLKFLIPKQRKRPLHSSHFIHNWLEMPAWRREVSSGRYKQRIYKTINDLTEGFETFGHPLSIAPHVCLVILTSYNSTNIAGRN